MSPERFDHLLGLVSPLITKKDTNFREAISPAERLALTLRFLATGESQISLTFLFRMGKATVSKIISETCDALRQILFPTYVAHPSSSEEWKMLAEEFEELWNLNHVVGAIDGKHIRIECPKNTGTLYHNYKGFFSLVLLAICDARYCFTLIDVGQYGSNNDSGVLLKSKINEGFETNSIQLPEPETCEGCDFDPLPYYLVGDEIFPLKTWLMRPFPGKLEEQQRVFNYRLSRARRVIENAFGILAARWRIFSKPIKASVENAERYTLACIGLHNYLKLTDNPSYCPSGFVDNYSGSGEIRLGEWRKIVAEGSGGIVEIRNLRGCRRRENAVEMRNAILEYVNGVGALEWQLDHVRRT